MSSLLERLEIRQEPLQYWLERGFYVVLVGLFVAVGGFIIASEVILPSSTRVSLEENDVAPRDVLAPRSLKYESEVLTAAKRDAAVNEVRDIYDPPDPAVESEQRRRARQILDYIENVRYDDFASLEQKKADLAAISDLTLSDSVAEMLLKTDDEDRWRAIDAQVMRLLEREMSGEVREDNIQAIIDDLPNLISASYSENEVQIITAIVGDLIRVNVFFNEELTNQAKIEAANNVPVEVRTFASGQMVIREGEIATAAHIEALEQFGLLQGTKRKVERFLGGVVAMGLITTILGGYLKQFHPKVYVDAYMMALLGVMFLIFLACVRLIDPESSSRLYYYPAAALAFLVATLVGAQFAIVTIAALAALAGVMGGSSLEFALLIVLPGTLGILSLGRIERLNSYFVAGSVVSTGSVAIAVVFALSAENTPSVVTIFFQIVGALANGPFSVAVALMGLYVVSSVLNIPTTLKILELSQPNHPLLTRLLREAPGTYQHSLQVANLAELAAQRVGANAALVRVAAMYHDVGKILNPHFFVENQADGVNPHDTLNNPLQSAKIITGHVTEGARLARRYHLPSRIRDFILEHHGMTQVMFFYRTALEQAEHTGEAVNIADYTYPGPRPQSRETAILMLADGCESSVRARRPQSRGDIEETVNYIFEARLSSGELDDSGLTLNDLRELRESFLTSLQGIFHPRIAYPGSPGKTESQTLPQADPSQLPPVVGKRQDISLTQEYGAVQVEGMPIAELSDSDPTPNGAVSADDDVTPAEPAEPVEDKQPEKPQPETAPVVKNDEVAPSAEQEQEEDDTA